MAETIKIGGELESTATGNVVAAASAIKDKTKNKNQGEINAETDTHLAALDTKTDNTNIAVGAIDNRLSTVEELADISIDGGSIGIGTAADFESDDPSDLAKVPTIGAMLGGANDGVYDISARHNGTKYADLAAALGTDGANVPDSLKRGGMSVKFVQSSDNKYVQFRCMADEFTTDVTKWQGVDDKLIAGSNNLAKSGEVANKVFVEKESPVNMPTAIHKWVSNNKWYSNTNVDAVGVSLVEGKTYCVMGDVETAYFTLNTFSPAEGQTPDYGSVDSPVNIGTIDNPYPYLFTAKTNDNYLYIITAVNSTDRGILVFEGLSINDTIKKLRQDIDNINTDIEVLDNEIDYKDGEWKELLLSSGTVITGKSLAGNGTFNTGTNRECIKIMMPITEDKTARKIRFTANANVNASFAFYRNVVNNVTLYLAENEVGLRMVPKSETVVFDIPQNTTYIIINTHDNTQSLAPTKVELQYESIKGETVFNNLVLYEQNSRIVDFSSVRFFNRDIIFDKKDVKVGDTVAMSMDVDTSGVIVADLCYIAFFDTTGTRISFFGDGSSVTMTQSHYETEFIVPANFSHAVLFTSLQGGCVVAAHSDRFTKINDEINRIENKFDNKVGGGSVYSEYIEIDLSECNTFTGCFISDSPTANTHKVWEVGSSYTNRVWKIIPVPSNARYMRIVAENNILTLFLHDLDTPVNGLMPDFADVDKKVYNFKNDDICLPPGTNYVVMQTHNTTTDISPDYVGFAETRPSVIAALDESLDGYQIGREIESVSCPNAAEVVMSTEDNDATQYDNELIGYFSVLKVSEELYYMYYSCMGVGETYITDSSQHLGFAYSTDGENWVRAIPNGITPPVAGTNLIFENNVIGVQVFKVMDNDYPYRMIASVQPDPDNHQRPTQTVMYKSADGVNFTKMRVIFPFYCDNQPSCIVRGNIVKVYIRWRSDLSGDSTVSTDCRFIGVCTIDIDGNVILPVTTFFGLNLYQASASILDERRDIAFPTRYLPPPFDTQSIQCFIIDGKEISRIDFDTENLIGEDELSYYVAPGLVNIGGDMYLYMSARNYSHNGGGSVANKICRIKRVKVQFPIKGRAWIYEQRN